PLVDPDLLEWLQLERAEDRGVVHQDVDAAERLHRFCGHSLHVFFIAYVRLKTERAGTGRLGDLGGRQIEFLQVGNHDRSAVGGEAGGERLADAAAGAGDDRDL